MHPEEPQNAPPTEGQTIPPEEQIIPTAGLVQEDEQTQGEDQGKAEEMKTQATDKAEEMADKVKEAAPESVGAAAGQEQSLARANPMPIALAVAFVAGVVFGRIASRR
jgi:F0F1-type ATP synthase assembly protein I